jgi:hypothetical protein
MNGGGGPSLAAVGRWQRGAGMLCVVRGHPCRRLRLPRRLLMRGEVRRPGGHRSGSIGSGWVSSGLFFLPHPLPGPAPRLRCLCCPGGVTVVAFDEPAVCAGQSGHARVGHVGWPCSPRTTVTLVLGARRRRGVGRLGCGTSRCRRGVVPEQWPHGCLGVSSGDAPLAAAGEKKRCWLCWLRVSRWPD